MGERLGGSGCLRIARESCITPPALAGELHKKLAGQCRRRNATWAKVSNKFRHLRCALAKNAVARPLAAAAMRAESVEDGSRPDEGRRLFCLGSQFKWKKL